MKIAFFGVKSWEKLIIEKEISNLNGYGIGIFKEEVQDSLEIAKEYEVISTFIYGKLDKDVLGQLPKLRMIAARSTGIDHIDLKFAKEKGISVVNVADYGTDTVAEFTWALILAVTKKITLAHQMVEDGEFSPNGLTGIDLRGSTLGVVGMGKIGSRVAEISKVFGMNLITIDSKGNLEDLMSKVDILTLHVPSLPSTKHMINQKNIKLMKKGSYLINTCRGPVVESEALIWALNNGILAGAGLDVIEEEMLVEQVSVVTNEKITKESLQNLLSYHLLRDRDDVVFTPHNAFNTKQAIERIVKATVSNINLFISSSRE